MILSIEKFMEYKEKNKDILPELRTIANNMNLKMTPQQLYNRNKYTNKNYKYNKNDNHQEPKNKFHNKQINNKHHESQFARKQDVHPQGLEAYSITIGKFNKLSPNNVNDIANSIKNLNITDKNVIDILIDDIFKKAIRETKFTSTFTKLCSSLISHYYNNNDGDMKGYFRCSLLNKSQIMFTNAINFCENQQNNEEGNVSLSSFQSKEFVLGCMIFIGNLYNEKILSVKIINFCCTTILNKIKKGNYNMIDLLIQLLMVIGKKFIQESNIANDIFEQISVLVNDTNLSKKEKFAIMDLLDCKTKNNWN